MTEVVTEAVDRVKLLEVGVLDKLDELKDCGDAGLVYEHSADGETVTVSMALVVTTLVV